MTVMEKPPILRGSEKEQIAALRDYLFRMAQSLETASTAEAASSAAPIVKADGSRALKPVGAAEKSIDDVRKNAQLLRDLILKSARDLEGKITEGDNTVMSYANSKVEEYCSEFVAQSDLGTFGENIMSSVVTTAQGIVQSFNYAEAIMSSIDAEGNVNPLYEQFSVFRDMQDGLNVAQAYYTEITGEIRHGFIWDPEAEVFELGIAISEKLSFTGAQRTENGIVYYELEPGQTLGLYTSRGWQFWIDGKKMGWFDSNDSMLHVKQIVVEESLQIGTTWQIIANNTTGVFEIRYIGG